MTFKHGKFEDSIVMRSLEKVAKEKGMVKEEPITKVAESKLDLTISSSLMENILKLCAGLRFNGLDKQANELEANYLAYKKANTLYETSKEKGEDLIHDAHPKGSHKLEGVAGDDLAVVETILDRHVKLIEVMNKKPTGKLASSTSIINAVKTALGEDYMKAANDKFKAAVNAMVALCNKVNTAEDTTELSAPRGIVGFRGFYYTSQFGIASIERHLNAMVDNLKNELSKPVNAAYIEDHMRGYITNFNYLIRTADNISKDRKSLYLDQAQKINDAFTEVKTIIDTGVDNSGKPPAPPPTPAADPSQAVLSEYAQVLQNIGLYKARVQVKELKNQDELFKWLDSVDAYVKKYQTELFSSKYKSDPEILNSYKQKLEAAKAKLEGFRQKWLP